MNFAGGAVEKEKSRGAELGDGFGDLVQDGLAEGWFAAAGLGFHAGGAVEDEDDGFDRGPAEAKETADEGAGDGENKGGDGEGAAGEDEDVAELFFASGFAGGLEEKGGGGPFNGAETTPIQKVDDHRNGGGKKTPKDRCR